MTEPFRYQFRVRYSEIDAQAVVFNAHYLTYADIVLTEYWRAAGLHSCGDGALEFHVASATVTYKVPIRADELIQGRARTVRIGRSSVNTLIELHGAGDEDDLRATIDLVHVHVDLASGKSVPLPDSARAVLMP